MTHSVIDFVDAQQDSLLDKKMEVTLDDKDGENALR